MSEAAETLAKQLKEWEAKVEDARETLRIAKTILPSLREALPRSGEGSLSPATTEGNGDDLQADSEPQGEEDLHRLRKSDEVQAAVTAALDSVPSQFEQGDIDDALEEMWFEVNRSTLRQNLLMMAKAEEGFRVRTPGKGRKATIFEKIAESDT